MNVPPTVPLTIGEAHRLYKWLERASAPVAWYGDYMVMMAKLEKATKHYRETNDAGNDR